MSSQITVNDFKWIKGKNDQEYIKLLLDALYRQKKITSKAVAKVKELSKQNSQLQMLGTSDSISRQAAIEAFLARLRPIFVTNQDFTESDAMIFVREVLESLPSSQPEPKTGKWINNIHDLPKCDQCGYMTPYDRAIDDYEYGNFCPNCGARMKEGDPND